MGVCQWTQLARPLRLWASASYRASGGQWSVPQVRAAKSIDEAVQDKFATMPQLKGGYVFDNPYFSGGGHERLTPSYAIMALDLFTQQGGLDADNEWSVKKFHSSVCLPLRVVELWEKQQIKRFGAVASNSPAFRRVVQMLQSRNGVAKVLATIPGPLQGKSETDQGIEERFLLVAAMERCKAGGLGPPMTLQQPASATGSTEAPPPGEATEALPIDDDAAEANVLADVAASLIAATTKPNDAVADLAMKVAAQFAEITYVSNPDDLVTTTAPRLGGNTPLVVLIDAATSRAKINTDFLDTAAKMASRCTSNKTRVIVTVNRRFDLMAKVMDKARVAFPKWQHFCVPVTSKRQQARLMNEHAQEFVFVLAPAMDKRGVPAVVSTGNAKDVEQLRLRCTERSCPHRFASDISNLRSECMDPAEEIDPDDRDGDSTDFLALMAADAEDEDDAADVTNTLFKDPAAQCDDGKLKRDYIVDLWSFARSSGYYDTLFKQLAFGDTGHVCCILTSTAHPGAAVVAVGMRMDTYVLAARLKPHALAHGKEVGRHGPWSHSDGW